MQDRAGIISFATPPRLAPTVYASSAAAASRRSSRSAEDIGKLPDATVAGSISRLPGVTAQRDKTPGRVLATSVPDMSPDFNGTLRNGREQASAGDSRSVGSAARAISRQHPAAPAGGRPRRGDASAGGPAPAVSSFYSTIRSRLHPRSLPVLVISTFSGCAYVCIQGNLYSNYKRLTAGSTKITVYIDAFWVICGYKPQLLHSEVTSVDT